MLKILFILLLCLHGLIHLMGFIKAFNLAPMQQLTLDISRNTGLLWLLTTVLFIGSAILFIWDKNIWWVPAIFALSLSQILIFLSWQDAKYGTVANAIILVVAIVGCGTWNFNKSYVDKVKTGLTQTATVPDSILTEADLLPLPEPVKSYLRYTGALNRPKVRNFKLTFSGQIRQDVQSPWMPFTSEQYNFMPTSTRLFFMKATMKHLPVAGFHCFENGTAYMDIRLLSLFKVQYQSGKEMGVAETVTFFNDMCCMAPATLIDPRVKWLETNGNQVRASFTNNGIAISAWLYFNEQGQLVDFISNDRFAVSDKQGMRQIPWSTPVKDYTSFDGRQLPGYADVIYNYPDHDFCYGNFRLTNVSYNCK